MKDLSLKKNNREQDSIKPQAAWTELFPALSRTRTEEVSYIINRCQAQDKQKEWFFEFGGLFVF